MNNQIALELVKLYYRHGQPESLEALNKAYTDTYLNVVKAYRNGLDTE